MVFAGWKISAEHLGSETIRSALCLDANRKMNWLTILLSYTLTVALLCLAILVWLEKE
jgi:hypothetical protein